MTDHVRQMRRSMLGVAIAFIVVVIGGTLLVAWLGVTLAYTWGVIDPAPAFTPEQLPTLSGSPTRLDAQP